MHRIINKLFVTFRLPIRFSYQSLQDDIIKAASSVKFDMVWIDKGIYIKEQTIKRLKELQPGVPWSIESSPTAKLGQELLGAGGSDQEPVRLKDAILTVADLGGKLLGIGSAFLLSLLFSFLIVLDLPKLSRSVTGLRDTSLGFIYDEVADSIFSFGSVLGRAMEAQLFISILNTSLTALGIWVLGIGHSVAFLATMVFICGFVPVVGTFVSSVPICLMALQASGVHLMLLAICLIILVHTVETYILNPKIYGHHLHLNPVLVLAILTIGGKLFQAWGLVLGLPICTYFFSYAIRNDKTKHSVKA